MACTHWLPKFGITAAELCAQSDLADACNGSSFGAHAAVALSVLLHLLAGLVYLAFAGVCFFFVEGFGTWLRERFLSGRAAGPPPAP